MKLKSAMYLGMALVVCSCSDGVNTAVPAPSRAPEVATMKIGFDDRTNAKYKDVSSSIFLNFMIELKEPTRNKDVTKLRIENPEGTYWQYEADELGQFWEPARNRFAIWNTYYKANPNHALLGKYKVTISEAGKEDSHYYMDAYVENDPLKNVGSVHSYESAGNPKIMQKPTSITAKIENGKLTVSATGVDSFIEFAFLWLYDANNVWIGGYDIGDPLVPDQYPDFTADFSLRENELLNARKVIIGFLSEKDPYEGATQRMMYRYFHAVSLQ